MVFCGNINTWRLEMETGGCCAPGVNPAIGDFMVQPDYCLCALTLRPLVFFFNYGPHGPMAEARGHCLAARLIHMKTQ